MYTIKIRIPNKSFHKLQQIQSEYRKVGEEKLLCEIVEEILFDKMSPIRSMSINSALEETKCYVKIKKLIKLLDDENEERT